MPENIRGQLVNVDADFVDARLKNLAVSEDLVRYIL